MQIIPQPISQPTVRSASHSSPFFLLFSRVPCLLFFLLLLLGSLCPLARSKPAGNTPCSNKAALLSMEVMITSLAAAPGVAFL